ncbi:MAG TPA: CBS domain-containing protein [Acidimicrobiia bacterium]|nr:CBS domain-containing protein [Acidimicrobiia bacterium]
MKVENILQSKGRAVETIAPGATMAQAIHRLTSAGIGALVVSEDGETVLGIISERDIVWALSRRGTEILELHVTDCMTRGGPVCASDDMIQDTMTKMTRSRQRHLPVLRDGKLCGLISLGDVVKNRLDELELETNVLRDAYITRR